MNISSNYWQGVGTSIFSSKPPKFAVDKHLNVIGNTSEYSQEEIQHYIDAWKISDMIICKKNILKNKNNVQNRKYKNITQKKLSQ
ncbi:MAG: hypothetical protein LBN95_05730 [Prevotellaceae bacterium]|jgi:hypothetical protein|nr:hypothetical protein [Prevotellaceae bacterium]